MDNLLEKSLARRDFIKMGALAGSGLLVSGLIPLANAKPQGKNDAKNPLTGGPEGLQQDVLDTLTAKDYSHLLGSLSGVSDAQLKAHFKLYENYFSKLNALQEQLAKADDAMLTGANPSYAPYRELHIEQGFMHNGVVLHEQYFGNLGAAGSPGKGFLALVNRDFGSWENYLKHLIALGKAMRGWAITGFDLRDGRIRNFGLDSHHIGMPNKFHPLLVLDVFEHAYMIDFATDRAKYIDVFVQNVNWNAVENRLMFVVHHAGTGSGATN